MTELLYKSEAVKSIKNLPKNEQKKVINKLELLLEDPHLGKALKGQLTGFYSLRAWPYRIIYQYNQNKIIVFVVAHRSKVYRL